MSHISTKQPATFWTYFAYRAPSAMDPLPKTLPSWGQVNYYTTSTTTTTKMITLVYVEKKHMDKEVIMGETR